MPDLKRTPEEVATRVVCLGAIVTRSTSEDLIAEGVVSPDFVALTHCAPDDLAGSINAWLEKDLLVSYLSPSERAWMAKPSGTWPRQEILDSFWRREALMALEWALQIVEPFPPQDVQLPLQDLLESSWLFKETVRFREGASLRLPQEISKQRDIAEFWLWRSRTSTLQGYSEEELRNYKTSKEKLRAIVDRAAAAGEKNGAFQRIDGDFPALGKPFRDLSSDEWSLMNSICTERLYGLNWLCAEPSLEWDSVETST